MHGDKPTDDDPNEVSLDVGDVDLAESAPKLPRVTAPPPLPISAQASSPPAGPSIAPPSAAPPPPRSKLVYVLVLAACLVASIGIGAVWARSSAPKPVAANVASAGAAAPVPSPAASGSVSATPKVITINPVDMTNEAP
ncbi:MAG: hypothetical protein JWP87_3784 [Labilithrix sp.]|nr:hypothetical protein [Labilithrix sp.]